MWAGGDVLSHPVSRAVPSALRGLTAVFGMGTGVAPAPWPPASTPHFVLLMTNGGSRERGFGKARLGRRSREYAQGDRPTVVSCRHSHPYGEGGEGQATRAISTAWLSTLPCLHLPPIDVLVSNGPSEGLRPGSAHLGEGFPLRCLQRFSRPNVATRRCLWPDSRHTRGPSVPVLSY